MRFDRLAIVARKEALDVLRDRRTLISMIVVPVFLFPVLMFVLPDLIISFAKGEAEREASVVVAGIDPGHPLAVAIEDHERLTIASPDDPAAALREGDLQAIVTVPDDFDQSLSSHTPTQVEVAFDSTALRSKVARDLLQLTVAQYGAAVVATRLVEKDVDPAILVPLQVKVADQASADQRSGAMVGAFLPYLLILLCMLGALYPAVDLTAGEKERGTLETLLVTPLGRMELVTGKFLTVLAASLTTAVLTCISLWATFAVAGDRISSLFGGASFSLSPVDALLLLVLLAPVACFFAALLIAMGTFARSYKEAMSYASPLMILVIIPAMISTIPGIEASLSLAIIPIAGASLLMGEVLTGDVSLGLLFASFVASCVYALGGMALSAWLFTREEILIRD